MKTRYNKNFRFKTNSTVNIEGQHLKEEFNRYKPDIIAWNEKKLHIVEFSCPYDNVSDRGDTLNRVYNEKANKYKSLIDECKKVYGKEVKLFTIIVSSLGVIHKKSIGEIRSLLAIADYEKKTMKAILRRISLSACIGSYFIFNNLKFKEYKVDTNSVNNDKETQDVDVDDEHRSEAILGEDKNSNADTEDKTEDGDEEEETNQFLNNSDSEEQINDLIRFQRWK